MVTSSHVTNMAVIIQYAVAKKPMPRYTTCANMNFLHHAFESYCLNIHTDKTELNLLLYGWLFIKSLLQSNYR